MTARSADDAPFDAAVLHALAGDYLAGAATADEIARLESLLVANPAARAEFVSLALVHGQLAATLVAAGAVDDPRPSPRPRTLSLGRAALRSIGQGVATRAAAGTVLVVAVAVVAVAMFLAAPARRNDSAYDRRQFPLATVAMLAEEGHGGPRPAAVPLTATTLRPRHSTSLTSASGAAVDVPEAAVFGLSSGAGGVLFDGSVEARLLEPDASFSVTAENLRIVDKGTAFRVDRVDADHVRVTVTDGSVEVQSRVRLPVCSWSFDDVAGGGPWSAADVVSGLTGLFRGGAAPAPGLVGRTAARFDNQRDSAVTIAGGTGPTVGTGLLAAADGITIEAVILSRWSGRLKDYDEIYRKEDGDCRVLLSFQNDGGNYGGFSEPVIAEGPCLSFGLHLAGRGYRELDMPLDGRAGRPTVAEIADGRPHHVVAGYDSFTGRKAIFIDGRLRYSHDYPVGTMILSGGPMPATIGNHGCCEPFTGTIDELAIYDFALTPDEVAQHAANVRRGASPFGGEPPAAGGPRWQAVTRLVAGESQAFNQRTGLPAAKPRDELDRPHLPTENVKLSTHIPAQERSP